MKWPAILDTVYDNKNDKRWVSVAFCYKVTHLSNLPTSRTKSGQRSRNVNVAKKYVVKIQWYPHDTKSDSE